MSDPSQRQHTRIHQLFVRQVVFSSHSACCAPMPHVPWLLFTLSLVLYGPWQELDSCLGLIDKVLEETNQLNEFALHVKGLIKRQQGLPMC